VDSIIVGQEDFGLKTTFAEIIDFYPEPCFAINLQGEVIAWNKAIAVLTGIAPEQMLGKGDYAYAVPFWGIQRPILIDLVHSWDDDIARTYKNIVKQGETLVAETENPPFKPEPSYFWNKAQKLYGTEGDCIGAIEVIRDITELKRSEQELKRTEAEKTLMLNITSEFVTYFDLDLRIKWLNRAAIEALGCKEGDLLGRPCYEVWHQRTEPCADCPVVLAKLTGQPQQAEIVTPDGRIWLARGYPVLDQSGNVISLIEFTLEITERKQIEEKLRHTTASLLEAQRIAKIGNWHWSIDSGRVTWSDEIFHILGLEKQEPSYELAISCVHPDDLLFWKQATRNALSGDPLQIDFRAIRPDGTTVWIHYEALTLLDETGRVCQIIGTAQDVTAQKTTELQLIEQDKQLRRLTALQQIIAGISTRFANTTANQINSSIDKALEDIGRFINADRSYLFQYSDDFTVVSNTHEWCEVGIRPEYQNLQNLPTAPLHWTLDHLRKGENIVVESVADMPSEAQAEKDWFQAQDIRSVLLVPVLCDDSLFGFIGFDAVRGQKKWISEDTLLLRTVSDIIGNAILKTRNEQERRKSEDRLKMALDAAEHGPWEMDLVTENVTVSPRMAEIFGIDQTHVLRTRADWCDFVEEEDRRRVQSAYDAVKEWKDGKCSIEFRIRRGSDCGMRWVRCEAITFKKDDGQIIRLVGIVADVTDRVTAQAALQDSEERFRLFMDKSQLMAWMKDEKGHYVYINQVLRQRFRIKDVNWVGKTGFDLWPSKIAAKFTQEDQNVLKTGQPFNFTMEKAGADGGLNCWIGTKFLFEDTAGNRFVAGLAVDITERKKIEESLRKSEERFRTIVKNMPGGVFAHDMDGKIIMVNEAAIKNTGYSQQELLEMSVKEIDPGSQSRQDRKNLWEMLQKGTSRTISSTHIRKDGSEYPVEVYLNAVELGNRPIILAIAFDISERKHAEASMRHLNETLEERVAQRTHLAESRLKQLQSLTIELIEAEDRERHRIAELLHDDLQQILAAAKMKLQTLIDDPSERPLLDDVHQLLEKSISKTRRLSHELSPPVMMRHSGLAESLAWLALDMEVQFGLKVEVKTEPEVIHSGPIKKFVFRAVKELLFNITKHACVKKARVVLSHLGKSLVVKVSDSGKGFDVNVLEPTAAVNGLGLLSIKERVRHMGGNLTIESSPGHGSQFTLTMPITTDIEHKLQAAVAAPLQLLKDEETIDATAGAIRIMFVDDHKVMRDGLIQLLARQTNIEVVGEAADGKEAVEKAGQLNPDLIIMDVSMPVMDGIEATRLIKAKMPHVRVVGLSMFEDEHITAAMLQAGAETFISKTASTTELLNAICGIKSREPNLPL
jgi:PAS domain S-box-containing protein